MTRQRYPIKQIATKYPLLAPNNKNYTKAKFEVTIDDETSETSTKITFKGNYELNDDCGLNKIISDDLATLGIRIESRNSGFDETIKIYPNPDKSFTFYLKLNSVCKDKQGNTWATPMIIASKKTDNLLKYISNDVQREFKSYKTCTINKGQILAIDDKIKLLGDTNEEGKKSHYFEFISDDNISKSFKVFPENNIIRVCLKNYTHSKIASFDATKKYNDITRIYMFPIITELIHQIGYNYDLTEGKNGINKDLQEAIWFDYFNSVIEEMKGKGNKTIRHVVEKILTKGKKNAFRTSLEAIEAIEGPTREDE